jgi:hypothetical protein
MLGFKSAATAATILSGIEMIHMMRKRQARYAYIQSQPINGGAIRNPRRLTDRQNACS